MSLYLAPFAGITDYHLFNHFAMHYLLPFDIM